MSIEVVRTLPEDVWRRFVDEHPQGNIFHTPEMFHVFAHAKGYRPELWAAVNDREQVLVLLSVVQVTLLGGLPRRLTTRAIAYGSVLCVAGSQGETALAMLLQAYKEEVRGKVLFTELRNLADLSYLQPVLDHTGFAYEDHLNYLIDLDRSPEAVLQSIGQRTRKKIRHALRQAEVVVDEIEQPKQVAVCYDLLRKTYAAAGVPLADRSLFEAAFGVLHPQGMVKFLLARIGDCYAAGSVELVYKDTIYGWYGGMDRAYSDHIPNEVLLWHVFRWGAENGCQPGSGRSMYS